jgi:hypothetical protein
MHLDATLIMVAFVYSGAFHPSKNKASFDGIHHLGIGSRSKAGG